MTKLSKLIGVAMLIPAAVFAKSGEVRRLDFLPGKEKSTFTVHFEGKPSFRVFQSEKQGSVIVEAVNLHLPARLTKLLDSSTKEGPVIQVTPYSAGDQKKPLAKFVLQLKSHVELVAKEVPGRYMLELKPKAGAAKAVKAMHSRKPKKSEAVGWAETDTLKNRQSAADRSEEVAKRLIEVLNAPPEDKVYFGSRVSFEGSGVDVHDIFRLVGAASELNIVTDKGVEYTSDFSVTDIPWDQLLDIVLDQAQLKAVVKGNVVRIVSGERYAKEQAAKLREIDIADENEPVIMAVIPLSFATAEEMRTMIDGLLVKRVPAAGTEGGGAAGALPSALTPTPTPAAPAGGTSATGAANQASTGAGGTPTEKVKLIQDFKRGEIRVDSRSNSLVVTNTKPAIDRIRRLVKELDVQLPQVLIDAKIIIASESFSRNMGVNWGGRATSTGSGRAGMGGAFNGQSVSLGDSEDAAAFTVASAAGTGAFGFQIGAGRHGNLNAQLSLAEVNGLSKTVASPRVIVNNKERAQVVDGQTLFISSDAGANASGTLNQVQAALDMSVTPQITNAGSVLMQVQIAKNQPTVVRGQTALENKQISTNVLVDSGETLVLGGVYQNSATNEVSGIPGLMNLPFIGQLFRTNGESTSKSELMVFITPEIMEVKPPADSTQL